MALYQLQYLSGAARELIDAVDEDEAEDLARRRLLFSEPGFGIAVMQNGIELVRVMQLPKRTRRQGTGVPTAPIPTLAEEQAA